jgi:hypothetical protein
MRKSFKKEVATPAIEEGTHLFAEHGNGRLGRGKGGGADPAEDRGPIFGGGIDGDASGSPIDFVDPFFESDGGETGSD